VIHDVGVAIRRLQKDTAIKNAMVVDCDVHHGNGTAAIFPPKSAQHLFDLSSRAEASNAKPESRDLLFSSAARCMAAEPNDVFTVSLHQFNNYPAIKPPSCIDVHFADGVEDEAYLWWLARALHHALDQFTPDLLCYIAGADPYKEDQLGGLSLSIKGLKRRDLMVLSTARDRNIPVMITYAGGYARNVEDTVTIHTNTVLAAREIFS
jgi:acetoin utilization deacetylase AcuC-like enzyme